MNTKLTLSLDSDIIQQAKSYAKGKGFSLSKLVEEYFKGLKKPKKHQIPITPLVKELTGVVSSTKKNISDKKLKYLLKKYS